MNTVPEIIDAFGGNSRFAEVIGKQPSTASEMRRRKSIPVTYWPILVGSEKGRKEGLTYDKLVAAHASIEVAA